jgi:putative transposase
VTFAFSQAETAHHPVRTRCRVLGVSVSGFYASPHRTPSARARTDRRLRLQLRAAHRASGGTDGSPRLYQALQQEGERVGRNRIIRLMRAEPRRGRPRRRFILTTAADPAARPAANLRRQRFTTPAPHRVWAADITALPTRDGWLYLAVLLDLYSRRVVGWAAGPTLETALVLGAWHRAVAQHRRALNPVHENG